MVCIYRNYKALYIVFSPFTYPHTDGSTVQLNLVLSALPMDTSAYGRA